MNIILFGSPGAGKGTQSNNLVDEFKLLKVSTGDLLRDEIKKKSLLGNKIKSLIDQGSFVSDEIINNLIENTISNKSYFNKLIFDGYPRNLNQAKILDTILNKYKQKITCVLSLRVNEETIVKRILGRLVCSECGAIFNKFYRPPSKINHSCDPSYLHTRSDDNEKVIKHRIQTYNAETLPIINYYKNQSLLTEIDGMKEIDEIYKEIRQFIVSL